MDDHITLDGQVLGTKRIFNGAYDLKMDTKTVTLNGHYKNNHHLRGLIEWQLRGEQTMLLWQNGVPISFREGDRVRAYIKDTGCSVTLVEKLDADGNVIESYHNRPLY
ncbi:MAG: hypothetical protein V1729_00825 [Candidatus Woesearchaeota archaeon]